MRPFVATTAFTLFLFAFTEGAGEAHTRHLGLPENRSDAPGSSALQQRSGFSKVSPRVSVGSVAEGSSSPFRECQTQETSKALLPSARVSVDPLSRGLELTKAGSFKGLRFPRARLQPKADMAGEMLTLLHEATASFISERYSMHVHSEESRELAAHFRERRGMRKTNIVEQVGKRSFLDQTAPKNKDPTEVKSYTSSGFQAYLDNQCRIKGRTQGDPVTIARFPPTYHAVYCVMESEIDFNVTSTFCLDSCGSSMTCRGIIKPAITTKLELNEAFAKERELDVDYSLLPKLFCVNSHLQKELNSLCVGAAVARRTSDGWVCYPTTSRFKAGDIDFVSCADDCGNLTDCMGRATAGRGEVIENWVQKLEYLTKIYCHCDERLVDGYYKGCQTRTRLGKTCQFWNVQAPHKHDDLKDMDHNFCRNPEGEPYIWCYTTDPKLRMDFCDPIGISKQYVQPESMFSLEYHSVGATPYKTVRIFSALTEDAVCGSPFLALADGIGLPVNSQGTFTEVPETTFKDGNVQTLLWENLKLAKTQRGLLLACICDFEFATTDNNPNGSCSKIQDFDVHGGFLRVAGPVHKELTVLQKYETARPFTLTISGLNLQKGDSLDIAKNVKNHSCLLRSLSLFLTVARGYMGNRRVSSRLLAAWLHSAFNLETTTAFASVKKSDKGYDVAVSEPFIVSNIDEYIVCWTGTGSLGKAVGVALRFKTTGFEVSENQVATYAVSSTHSTEAVFSLFVRYSGPALDLTKLLFTLRETSNSPCDGKELSRSVSVMGDKVDEEIMILRGTGFVLKQVNQKIVSDGAQLQLCLDTPKGTVFAGFVAIREFGLVETRNLEKGSTAKVVPNSTYELPLVAFSPIGMHWLEGDRSSFWDGSFLKFFTEGEFLKGLSFVLFDDHITVYAWSTEDVLPYRVGRLEVKGWNDFTSYVTFTDCFFYAALGGSSPAVAKFDARDPRSLANAQPVATFTGPDLHTPCCLVTIYESTADRKKPYILLLDPQTSAFLWLDENLQLVEKRSNWKGLTQNLLFPCSMSCIERITSNYGVASAPWDVFYDCYIADRDAHHVLHIEVDVFLKSSSFVREYYSLGKVDEKLYMPVSLVALNYEKDQLLFLLQEGRQAADLIVQNHDGTVDYYSTAQTTSAGLGLPALPAVVALGDKNSGLNHQRVIIYRTTADNVLMQTMSLDATAVAGYFTYSPPDWYTVGDEVKLEPVVADGSSLTLFKAFTLSTSVPNFEFVRQVASVDKEKGTVTIKVAPFTDYTLRIGVIGQGVVNEVASEFTIRIACKSGHYMRRGMCAKCAVGTFNSLTLVKLSPNERWGSCVPCKEKYTSTISEGSTSEEQCICAKGYHIEEAASSKGCVPCPAGSWKDTVSNTGCVRSQCPANSSTTVVGAISAEDRKCACFPGFIYDKPLDACILTPAGTFSPGGYQAAAIPCPPNTTTTPSSIYTLTSLKMCYCDKGYEPADPRKLADPNSAEAGFRAWLRSIPEYAQIKDSQVCVPCGRTKYKDTVSNKACVTCPTASYSSSYAPKSKAECSLCMPGYYQTTLVEIPCGRCPDGAFCVGNEPPILDLQPFAGTSKPCPANSSTTFGSTDNSHPFKCMCLPGYAPVYDYADRVAFYCEAVKQGYFKDLHSNTQPIECPFGGKSEQPGADSVELCICGPGEYRDEETKHCTPCPKGFYCLGGRNPEIQRETPKVQCAENMTTAGTRAKSHDDCVCSEGYYRLVTSATEENVTCVKCPVNTYKDSIGNGECRPCNDNSGTNETGATSAAQCLCNGGYYYSDQLKLCTACREPHKFCPGGSIPCTDEPSCVGGFMPAPPVNCPPNTRITAGFDTPHSIEDCLCDRGFAFRRYDEENKKICEPCPPGSFKSSVQDSNCNGLCDTYATSLPGMLYQSQCFCEAGTYYAGGDCHSCPEGATCPGGLTKEASQRLAKDAANTEITSADHLKPIPQPGYFLEKLEEQLNNPHDWLFLKCPVRRACLADGECSETMADYLCSECKQGYTNTFKKAELCTMCPSFGLNIVLCIAYYIGVLLFNIGMAYMNVAAGFNRRSIHSIVIKIASNFLTCISVLSTVDYELIELPSWFYSLKTNVKEHISSTEKTHWMSVDCILRDRLHLSYGDSFFYTMMFYAILPVVLAIIATIIMFIIVSRTKYYYRRATQRKLVVLEQTIRFNLVNLTEQLRDKFEEDRLFMMFRYVPLPGESNWKRINKFFEDMTPIYVTVLFFMYTSTTSNMLSLLECTSIDFGDVYGSGSYLSAAMSVECSLSRGSEYSKFFILGIVGLITWSIGIPLGAFLVLYAKRKNLNSREARLKYGFLHNGFVKKYWYWETVVFARKLCVLIVSSLAIGTARDESSARIMLSAIIAISFNVIHLRCQPFDKRSYLTLDRLENHSMAMWTMATCMMSLLLGAHFSGEANIVLISLALIPFIFFALEVGVSLVFAYFDNVRATRTFFTVPFIGRIFIFFAHLSEMRKAREPVVLFDEVDQAIQLVAAKRVGGLLGKIRLRNKSIGLDERTYFLKVMAEALGFAVVHLRLDVVPGSFLEFAVRLGLSFAKLEEDSQNSKASLQAIAGGDMTKLVDWTRQEEAKKQQRKQLVRTKGTLAVRMHSYYTEWEKKIEAVEGEKVFSSDEEEHKERIRDINGGDSEENSEESEKEEKEVEQVMDSKLLELEKVVSRMTEEEQAETMYLFDEKLMHCGIALSELYLALLKLQLKSPGAIGDQFEAFREKKDLVLQERAAKLRMRNRKLKIIRNALKCALNSPKEAIPNILPTLGEYDRMQSRLDELGNQVDGLKELQKRLRTEPDTFDTDLDNYLDWIDTTGETEHKEHKVTEFSKKDTKLELSETLISFHSSGSDLSEK